MTLFLQPLWQLFSKPTFWLLLVIGFTLVYFFLEHEGFYFGDDHDYSLFAMQLLQGTFHFDNYSFSHRFMVFVPTAFFYLLGGHNVYTTTLWPLLCTLGTLYLLYASFKKEHPVATCWALVLLGLYYFQLNTVNYLYPDNILLFFTTTCLLILYKLRNPLAISPKQELNWGISFAVLNLLAFLTKETIVYTVPFYLALFFLQIRRKQNIRFWVAAAATGAVLLTIYFLSYKIFTGDMLLRLHDIAATNTDQTRQDYLDSRSATLLPRLTYGPLLFFIGSALAIPAGFALLSFLRFAKPVSWREPHGFWLLAMVCMLFPIWFGSATVDFYKPMPLVPRMFHPLLPAFCLTAGLALEKAWNHRNAYLFMAVLFGLGTWLSGDNLWVVYAPLAVLFLALYLYNRPVPFWLGLGAVALVSAIRPVYFILKPTVSYYFEQKKIIDQHLRHATGTHVVLMDSTMLWGYEYFYGYQVPKNYTFKRYEFYSAQDQQADTVFLLINNGVLEHPELMMTLREQDILPKFPTAKLLAQEKKVKLFYLPKDSISAK
ncbi:hypothetical protein TH61_02620 [Rufibacter sp. DG15C]|uniref:ArnT family glycosyltransferase n=1 Tax=Rufibacter sp. DG15C TaxID=1379909 RepID=UPI00078BDCCA|nr:glycosyltransferase family 39 protein [Rufibacter sp. DG15C]AMM50296.1 hypothetical protein TH61_02620 [Rufibacter sp. DG15C]